MGGIFLDSTRRSLVLVLSLFSSYNVIKLLFWFIILADTLNPRISRYIVARCPFHLGFLEKLVLKAGVQLKPVFPPLNRWFSANISSAFQVIQKTLCSFHKAMFSGVL